jgi:type IV secretory pathway TraG/TraD family ATPase VirD4
VPLLFAPSYRHEGKREVLETHNPFVRALLPEVSHHGTRSFWQEQWPTWTANARREWVQSTEGRIFQYLFDERLLMSVCAAEHNDLDFRRLIADGYWLFVNLPYALLSDTITTLMGNLIATRLFYAAMQRPPGSAPYRLILDEARFFNSGPRDVILETARAYNLWLTLVVQSLDQMCRSLS